MPAYLFEKAKKITPEVDHEDSTASHIPSQKASNYEHSIRRDEEELNSAIERVMEYEGNVENEIFNTVVQTFPNASRERRDQIIRMAVEDIIHANQVMEFNRIGNELYAFEAIKYISVSWIRRIFLALEAMQPAEALLVSKAQNNEGGIGFLTGFSRDIDKWVEQINQIFSGETNPRVLTTLAYSLSKLFRDEQTLNKTGDLVDQELLNNKIGNPRTDIFKDLHPQQKPIIATPLTTQPIGWPWIKYFTWHVSPGLPNPNAEFVSSEGHSRFVFSGMNEVIKPPLYNSHSLKEEETFSAGYSNWKVQNSSIHGKGSKSSLSVNWYQQNMGKYLPMFSGPSSTTSFQYEVARLLKIPAAETPLFRLLMLTWMIQGRDHSFTEIMGAFDAYAQEHEKGGPATVDGDGKLAWQARKTKQWAFAYNDLIVEDIDLPELEEKEITLAGKSIKLPIHKALKIKKSDLDEFLTGSSSGEYYPSYYASEKHIIAINDAIENESEVRDPAGLLSQRILYAGINYSTQKLYDIKQRQKPSRLELGKTGSAFLTVDEEQGFKVWVNTLDKEEKQRLLLASASFIAESSQASSIVNVFNLHSNPVFDVFLTLQNTNSLTKRLNPPIKQGKKDNFNSMLNFAEEKSSMEEREAVVLEALAEDQEAQLALIQGALLAATRLYTQEGSSLVNPGYGGFAPPESNEQLADKLNAVLNSKQYSRGDYKQAKKEINNFMYLLSSVLKSPLYKQSRNTMLWHAAPSEFTDWALNKRRNVKFPGFMSTSYDPETAVGYFLAKETTLQINPSSTSGAYIENISRAAGEKEVLLPFNTSFDIEKVYEIFLLEGEYPETHKTMVKKSIYNIDHGKPKKIIVAPEGYTDAPEQSDLAGEQACKSIINEIKKLKKWVEGKYRVVIVNLND